MPDVPLPPRRHQPTVNEGQAAQGESKLDGEVQVNGNDLVVDQAGVKLEPVNGI